MEYVYIYTMTGEISIKASSKKIADSTIKEMSMEDLAAESDLAVADTEFVEAREESEDVEEE